MSLMQTANFDSARGLLQWLDAKWREASFRFGIARPDEDTEIHTFRVQDTAAPLVKCCRRSVIPVNHMSNPTRTVEQIIEAWPGFECY